MEKDASEMDKDASGMEKKTKSDAAETGIGDEATRSSWVPELVNELTHKNDKSPLKVIHDAVKEIDEDAAKNIDRKIELGIMEVIGQWDEETKNKLRDIVHFQIDWLNTDPENDSFVWIGKHSFGYYENNNYARCFLGKCPVSMEDFGKNYEKYKNSSTYFHISFVDRQISLHIPTNFVESTKDQLKCIFAELQRVNAFYNRVFS